MGPKAALASGDTRFDLPPWLAVAERRMADRALQRWQALGHRLVDGFADNQIVISDPLGSAVVETIAQVITITFGVTAGAPLDPQVGLAAEVRAAADLAALHCVPLPFEATLPGRNGSALLMRGIALPITRPNPELVQVIINWRETLDRSAKTRLQRELGAALREIRPLSLEIDPFDPRFRKSPIP